MKKYFIVCILFSLFFKCVAAENSRFYKAGQLTSHLITSICQDGQGYIWIATEYGLNKFDGVQFTQYFSRENNPASLSNNTVRTMMNDKENRLWIGCSNGLQYYVSSEDAFHTIPFQDNLFPSVTRIVQLHTGKIWLIGALRGIFELDEEQHIVRPLTSVNTLCETAVVDDIYEDHKHRMWIATAGKGLLCLDASGKILKRYTFQDLWGRNVRKIREDAQGNIVVVVNGKLAVLDENQGKFVPFHTDYNWLDIRDVIRSKEGILYVATYGQGLFYVDKKEGKLLPTNNVYTPFFNVGLANMVSVLEDREQNLWLGCFQKGVVMVPTRPTSFHYWDFTEKEYNSGDNLGFYRENHGVVTFVYRDSRGDIWGGLEKGGLFKFDQNGQVTEHIKTSGAVISAFEDSEHTFWVGTYAQGLGVLNTRTGQCDFIPQLSGKRVKCITEDSEKNLFCCLLGEGLWRYNLRTKEEYEICRKNPETRKLLKNTYMNVILCDKEDLIWIGHYAGISCYDVQNDCFMRIKGDSVLNSCVCYSLLESRDGNIWIGTNNGLYVWNKSEQLFKRYTTENGLSSNMICGLAEDNEGNIWCSTFRGINQLKLKEKRIINYYTGSGLVDKEYTRGAYFQDKDGIVYFGGSYGVTCFSPSEITNSEFRREVMLTNMYIGNVPVNTKTVSGRKAVIECPLTDATDFYLTHEDNTFTFEFSTMDYREPENINYEYRLLGLDAGWNSTLLGVHRLTYNHLPPGNYTLEVRACENGFYTPVKQLQIHIAFPWYRTIYAYICYFLLLSALVAQSLFILKRRRQEEINEAKLKFFINISHEIRSPMTLIISPLESLLKRDFDESAMKALRSMYKNANRILELINQLLDIRKIDKGQMRIICAETDLVGFIEDLYKTFDYQAEKRRIRFVFEHEMEKLPVWIDRNNFDKVLVNLLSNAFKYTPEDGEIRICLSAGTDRKSSGPLLEYAEIMILDSGPGIDETKLEKIFERFYQASADMSAAPLGFGIGLNLCRLLVNLHHGTVVASNRKDRQGSCFTIRIPLGNAFLKKEEMTAEVAAFNHHSAHQPSFIDEHSDKKTVKSKTGHKVLVVDDNEDVRDFLKTELGEMYKVLVCTNGDEGLQTALLQLPDVIVSDVKMPVMDGFTMLKKLKNNSNTNHIPIILLTSKTEHADRIQGLGKGADAYMAKPFNIEELETLIANLIENRIRLKGKFSGALQEDKIRSIEVKSNDNILLERVMKIVNDNIDNPELNVEMLAEQVGLSRVQLHRKLKELTGVPTGEFIRNIRLKQAAVLLKERKVNISQVAYVVGFSSQTHFSTAFKKFYGVSPTEFIAMEEKKDA
ncbi:hybrid sensor histidine kinase/response regulator transcription factor [Bacteroides acidifaciens]|uniref:hybrid sensor histidine kinase/response regulator transcription factor n=1 Tax=Bacteroides acidifaciens TaxID=85831 RepID=UPI0024322E21|nr:hybrid sensor histidine kinase/response regulator transcription factor [Bacteroides acidifaciens]